MKSNIITLPPGRLVVSPEIRPTHMPRAGYHAVLHIPGEMLGTEMARTIVRMWDRAAAQREAQAATLKQTPWSAL